MTEPEQFTPTTESVEPEKRSFLENLKQQYQTYEANVMEKLSLWSGHREVAKQIKLELYGGMAATLALGLLLGVAKEQMPQDLLSQITTYGMIGPGIIASLGAVAKGMVDLTIIAKDKDLRDRHQ